MKLDKKEVGLLITLVQAKIAYLVSGKKTEGSEAFLQRVSALHQKLQTLAKEASPPN